MCLFFHVLRNRDFLYDCIDLKKSFFFFHFSLEFLSMPVLKLLLSFIVLDRTFIDCLEFVELI